MAKELSIEEAFGTAPTSTATSEPKELSIEEAFGATPAAPAVVPEKKGFFEKLIGDRLAQQKAADAATTLAFPSLGRYHSVLEGKQMPADVPVAPQLDMARKREVASVDNLQATPTAFTKGQELKEDTNAHGIDYAANLVQRGAIKAYLEVKKAYAGMNQFAYDTLGIDMPSNKQRLEDIYQQEQGIGEAKNKPAQFVEGALNSIGQQLPAMLGGVVTGSEPLVLGHMFAQTFGQNYDEGKRAGLDYRDNTVRSGLLSSFEVIGEKAGLSDRFKLFKSSVDNVPTSELASHLANFVKKNVPGELTTFAGQYGTDVSYGLQKPSWESFLNGAADTVLATLTQDTIMGGAAMGTHAALKAALPPTVGTITPIQKGPTTPTTPTELSIDQAFGTAPSPAQPAEQLQKAEAVKQAVENPIPPVTAHTNVNTPGNVNPQTAGILQREQEVKQEVEHPELSAAPAAIAPAPTHIDPETGEILSGPAPTTITPTQAASTELPQRGVHIDPETGEIIEASTPVFDRLMEFQKLPPPPARTEPVITDEDNVKILAKVKELIDIGVPSKDAINIATKEFSAENNKVQNATRPDTSAVGTSVQTPGQPTAVQRTTSGAQGAQRNGVVSGNQNAPSNNVGKGKQPAAIGFKEDLETPELTDEEITQRLKDQALKEEEQNKPEEFEEEQTTPTTTTTVADTRKKVKEVTELTDEQIAAKLKKQSLKEEKERRKAEEAKEAAGRGRPSNKTPEEQAADLAAYRTANQTTQNKKNEIDRTHLPKITKYIKDSFAPINEELSMEEAEQAEQDKANNKRYAIRKLVEFSAIPELRGTATGRRINALLNDRKLVSQQEIDNARRGQEIAAKALADKESLIGPVNSGSVSNVHLPSKSTFLDKPTGKPSTRFNSAKTGQQALDIVKQTGTKFEKFLAGRLRPFMKNVQFVVIEDGQEIAKEARGVDAKGVPFWSDTTQGLYVEDPTKKQKIIFVRGNGSIYQGINNTTVLHEAWHAATNYKINIGKEAYEANVELHSPLVKAYMDLLQITKNTVEEFKNQAIQELDAKEAAGDTNGNLSYRLNSIMDLIEHGPIAADPREFVAYALNDEDLQEFLMDTKGFKTNESLWDKFVDTGRRLLGIPPGVNNALSDILVVSNNLLRARPTSLQKDLGLSLYSEPTRATGKQTNPPAQGPPVTPAQAKAKLINAQHNKQVSKGAQTVAVTRGGPGYSAAVKAQSGLRTPSAAWNMIRPYWDNMTYEMRNIISAYYSPQTLADGGPGEIIPEFKNTYELMQRMAATKYSIIEGAAKIDRQLLDYFREDSSNEKEFAELTNGTTIDQYDPSKNNVKPNKHWDDIWKNMTQTGKDAYINLRNYYDGLNKYRDYLLEEDIKKMGLPAGDETKLIAYLHQQQQQARSIAPYFPLTRDGDFVLKYVDNGIDVTRMYNSIGELNEAARAVATALGKSVNQAEQDGDMSIVAKDGAVHLRSTIESNSSFLKSAYEILDKATLNAPGARDKIKDQFYETYLRTMPEQSLRKMFLPRKGEAGYSMDVRKSLSSFSIKAGNQFAKLKYGRDLDRSLEVANNQLIGKQQYKPFYNRMDMFVKEALDPTISPNGFGKLIADGVTKASFFHYLTGFKTAFLQPMDIYLTGMPVLAGKHGYIAATNELNKAMWMFEAVKFNPNGTTYQAPTILKNIRLTRNQRAALEELGKLNVFNNTLANEVFDNASKKVTKTDSLVLSRAKLAGRTLVLGGLMHHGERISREAVAFASYNLNESRIMKEGRKNGETLLQLKDRAHTEAIAQARKDVENSLGNYDPTNRPMFMRGTASKFLTMYKFLPVTRTTLLCNNFARMLPFLNKEGKAEAARTFFGVLGTHFLVGGLKALPVIGIVMGIIGAIWDWFRKDPDAPEDMQSLDFNTWLTSVYIPRDVFGDTKLEWLGDVINSGFANKLTGWDISNTISLNDMLFRAPEPAETVEEDIINWAKTLGGPGLNYLLSTARAYEKAKNGDYEEAIETLAPGMVSAMLAAHREVTQGAVTTKGSEILNSEEVTKAAVVGRALGFKNAEIAERQEQINKANLIDIRITNEKKRLSQNVADAFRKSIDFQHMSEAQRDRAQDKLTHLMLEKVPEFDKKYPSYKFGDGELADAMNKGQERAVMPGITQGVRITPENAPIIGELVGAMADKRDRLHPDGTQKEMSIEEAFGK